MVLGASVQFARPSWKSAFKMSSLKNSQAKFPLVMDSSFSERAFPHSVFDIFGNNQSSVSGEIFIQKQLKRRKWRKAKLIATELTIGLSNDVWFDKKVSQTSSKISFLYAFHSKQLITDWLPVQGILSIWKPFGSCIYCFA